ncbi:hypothetical protein LZ30DRAFT_741479 [Colletotrichum cereale]|nr:hypothetical protein LZ30DRAFT_741479 [Colletotrichum cereale]
MASAELSSKKRKRAEATAASTDDAVTKKSKSDKKEKKDKKATDAEPATEFIPLEESKAEKKERKRKEKEARKAAEAATEASTEDAADPSAMDVDPPAAAEGSKKDKKEKKSKKSKPAAADDEDKTGKKEKKEKKDKKKEKETIGDAAAVEEKSEKKSKKSKKSKDEPAAEAAEPAAAAGDEEETPAEGAKREKYIVFVGNLPYTANKESIMAHFAAYKPTTVRCLNKDGNPNVCRGIAFLEFSNGSNMRTCLDKMHHTEFDDGLSPARRINLELSAGGGGKSKFRKEKIKERNVHLDENRAKRLQKEEEGKKQRATPGGVSSQQDNNIHPSRLAMMSR